MSFGSRDLPKLYRDFGATENFILNPAVRHPTGSCIEERGCDYEKVTLCAFEGATPNQQVNFLVCMDEEREKALPAAKGCASLQGLDADKVAKCFASSHADDLLAEASKVFNKQFPSAATVPHLFINAKDTRASYNALKEQLCADGSKATVCSGEKATVEEATCVV